MDSSSSSSLSDDSSSPDDSAAYDIMRRQSTASNISRHSSCPDLAACGDNNHQDVYDLELETERPMFLKKPHRKHTHSTMKTLTPLIRQRFHSSSSNKRMYPQYNMEESYTPTVMSNYGERKVIETSKPEITKPQNSTQRLIRQTSVGQRPLSRTSSCEMNAESCQMSTKSSVSGQVLSTLQFDSLENFQAVDGASNDRRHRHVNLHDTHNRLSQDYDDVPCYHGNAYVTDDAATKCQHWLQSLHITQSDKIKSRSHIQLPPLNL